MKRLQKSQKSPENTLKTDMDATYIMKSHENTSLKDTNDVGHATKLKQPVVPPVMPNVIVQEDFHNKNWRAILLKWSSAGCYEELKNMVTREKFLPISPGVHHEMQPEDTIDWVAMNFFPDDGPKNALPVSTYGDGNCFPRAISKILFGTEQHHCEIRARIVKEGIENETELTTDAALTRGQNIVRRNSLCTQYVMYSGVDIQGMGRITRKEVREVYRKELLNISRVGEFMGIWQFHQACEVLKRPLGTIYPQGTSPHIRNDLNRIILPINRKYDNLTPVYVMWTPLHLHLKPYDVKHFVPLLRKPL